MRRILLNHGRVSQYVLGDPATTALHVGAMSSILLQKRPPYISILGFKVPNIAEFYSDGVEWCSKLEGVWDETQALINSGDYDSLKLIMDDDVIERIKYGNSQWIAKCGREGICNTEMKAQVFEMPKPVGGEIFVNGHSVKDVETVTKFLSFYFDNASVDFEIDTAKVVIDVMFKTTNITMLHVDSTESSDIIGESRIRLSPGIEREAEVDGDRTTVLRFSADVVVAGRRVADFDFRIVDMFLFDH